MKNLTFIMILFIFFESASCAIKSPEINPKEIIEMLKNDIDTNDILNCYASSMKGYCVQINSGDIELSKFIAFIAKVITLNLKGETTWKLVADDTTENTKIYISQPKFLTVCEIWGIFMDFLKTNGFIIDRKGIIWKVRQEYPTNALQMLPFTEEDR